MMDKVYFYFQSNFATKFADDNLMSFFLLILVFIQTWFQLLVVVNLVIGECMAKELLLFACKLQ